MRSSSILAAATAAAFATYVVVRISRRRISRFVAKWLQRGQLELHAICQWRLAAYSARTHAPAVILHAGSCNRPSG